MTFVFVYILKINCLFVKVCKQKKSGNQNCNYLDLKFQTFYLI